jgi:hypothetical protein
MPQNITIRTVIGGDVRAPRRSTREDGSLPPCLRSMSYRTTNVTLNLPILSILCYRGLFLCATK